MPPGGQQENTPLITGEEQGSQISQQLTLHCHCILAMLGSTSGQTAAARGEEGGDWSNATQAARKMHH